jgi:pimeloyl-ACP methyl ester carboxylesterase
MRDLTLQSFSELDIDGLVPRSWAEKTAQIVFGESTFRSNPDLVELWIDRWTQAPARTVFHQGMTWIGKRDLLEQSKSITIPVLLIQDAEETAYLNAWAEPMLETVERCSMVTIPNAGHFVNLEQPEAFNKAVREFLDTL